MSLESGATVGGWTLGDALGGARFVVEHGDGREGILSVYALREGGLSDQVHAAQRQRLEAWSQLGERVQTEGEWGVEGDALWVVLPEPCPRADDEPWPLARALSFLVEVTELLAPAHAAGVAHGEVDPWTVLTGPEGPRLICPGARPGPLELHALGIHVDPRYAAPEVLDRLPASPAGDVYSLGLLLQRLLSGKHPVVASDPLGALAARGEGQLHLTPEAAPYLAHLMAPLEQRTPNAKAARALLSGPPPPPPPSPETELASTGKSSVPLYLFVFALLAVVAGGVFARVVSPAPGDPTAGYRFDLTPYRE